MTHTHKDLSSPSQTAVYLDNKLTAVKKALVAFPPGTLVRMTRKRILWEQPTDYHVEPDSLGNHRYHDSIGECNTDDIVLILASVSFPHGHGVLIASATTIGWFYFTGTSETIFRSPAEVLPFKLLMHSYHAVI
jgi:hypothetical protein